MNKFRSVAVLALGALALAANAAVSYTFYKQSVSFNTGESFDLDALELGTENQLLTYTAPAGREIKIGGGASPRNSATVTIIYTATSDQPVGSVGLNVAGHVVGNAAIAWSEYIEDLSGNLLSKRSGLYGPDYGVFADSLSLDFAQNSSAYLVKKTFSLVNLSSNPVNASAALDLIEQNAAPVPEPASMAALAVGTVALLRRRRRNA